MQFNFNAANAPAPTAPEYGPLPAGEYTMIITRTEIKPTKAGTGEYLECVMEVVEGKSAGRKHWERFNVSNPNKTAEDIAKAALGNLCMAIGLDNVTDTDQLHDRMFIAKVAIDRKDPERNRIMGYSPAAQSAPARPAAQPKPAAARPWQ